LAKEIAMLSQASADLHAGRPAAALTVLDEHQRKFPHGELGQERTSGRIQALCALGRMTEAQAELARLARTSPNSPHLARARKACGSGATQKE
jgi:predicted Zn-dependent protease